VLCADDAGANALPMPASAEVIRYGLTSPDARLRAERVRRAGLGSVFDVVYDGEALGEVTLAVPGEHNVRNALAALAAGLALGLTVPAMAPGLAAFRGVERRFQLLGEAGGALVVDDYAHHPTEVRATIEAARAAAPERSGGLASRWRSILAVFAALVLLASPLWGPPVLRRLDFFRVRRVEILGARYTAPGELLDRLRVDTTRSVWDPLDPLAARLRTHAQIESVTVTRRLPGTLVVRVKERHPVALVDAPGGLRAVDERGRRLPLDPSRTPVDAPVVTAAPRDTLVYHLLGEMQREAPTLYARLSSIRPVGADEIVLQISELSVRAMTNVTLARLGDIDPVQRDLTRRQLHPTEIDLRYRDQVIARLP
jgi:cell division septal protein FtsQ